MKIIIGSGTAKTVIEAGGSIQLVPSDSPRFYFVKEVENGQRLKFSSKGDKDPEMAIKRLYGLRLSLVLGGEKLGYRSCQYANDAHYLINLWKNGTKLPINATGAEVMQRFIPQLGLTAIKGDIVELKPQETTASPGDENSIVLYNQKVIWVALAPGSPGSLLHSL
jgi:hypothetical protein